MYGEGVIGTRELLNYFICCNFTVEVIRDEDPDSSSIAEVYTCTRRRKIALLVGGSCPADREGLAQLNLRGSSKFGIETCEKQFTHLRCRPVQSLLEKPLTASAQCHFRVQERPGPGWASIIAFSGPCASRKDSMDVGQGPEQIGANANCQKHGVIDPDHNMRSSRGTELSSADVDLCLSGKDNHLQSHTASVPGLGLIGLVVSWPSLQILVQSMLCRRPIKFGTRLGQGWGRDVAGSREDDIMRTGREQGRIKEPVKLKRKLYIANLGKRTSTVALEPEGRSRRLRLYPEAHRSESQQQYPSIMHNTFRGVELQPLSTIVGRLRGVLADLADTGDPSSD